MGECESERGSSVDVDVILSSISCWMFGRMVCPTIHSTDSDSDPGLPPSSSDYELGSVVRGVASGGLLIRLAIRVSSFSAGLFRRTAPDAQAANEPYLSSLMPHIVDQWCQLGSVPLVTVTRHPPPRHRAPQPVIACAVARVALAGENAPPARSDPPPAPVVPTGPGPPPSTHMAVTLPSADPHIPHTADVPPPCPPRVPSRLRRAPLPPSPLRGPGLTLQTVRETDGI